jgi:hypothetical protein
MVVAAVLFIAWFAVGFAPWEVGLAVAALIGLGAAQLAGVIPAI